MNSPSINYGDLYHQASIRSSYSPVHKDMPSCNWNALSTSYETVPEMQYWEMQEWIKSGLMYVPFLALSITKLCKPRVILWSQSRQVWESRKWISRAKNKFTSIVNQLNQTLIEKESGSRMWDDDGSLAGKLIDAVNNETIVSGPWEFVRTTQQWKRRGLTNYE